MDSQVCCLFCTRIVPIPPSQSFAHLPSTRCQQLVASHLPMHGGNECPAWHSSSSLKVSSDHPSLPLLSCLCSHHLSSVSTCLLFPTDFCYHHLSSVATCQGLPLSDQINNFLTFRSKVLNQGLIKNPLYPPASVSDGREQGRLVKHHVDFH